MKTAELTNWKPSEMASLWDTPKIVMRDDMFRSYDEVFRNVFDMWDCDLEPNGVKQYFVVTQFIKDSKKTIGEFDKFDDAITAFDNTTHSMEVDGKVVLYEVRRYVGNDFKKPRMEYEVERAGIVFSKW